MQRRLARGGYEADAITAAIDRLRKQGLLDDVAFAQYWLDQRRQFRPRGARLLRAELRQRGVPASLAAEATQALEAASVEDDAYRVARKPGQRLAQAGVDERTFRTRLGQFLARRGFDWDVIAPVVERLRQEISTS